MAIHFLIIILVVQISFALPTFSVDQNNAQQTQEPIQINSKIDKVNNEKDVAKRSVSKGGEESKHTQGLKQGKSETKVGILESKYSVRENEGHL